MSLATFPPAWFLSVSVLIEPKPIQSLVDLWEHMFPKQAASWRYMGAAPTNLKEALDELLELGKSSSHSDEVRPPLDLLIPSFSSSFRYMTLPCINSSR